MNGQPYMAERIMFRDEQVPGKAWGVSWIVSAPWAHPFWSEYLVHLYDLTTPMEKPPVLYMPGVTHEVLMWAIDPGHPVVWTPPVWPVPVHCLEPANHGYQFVASSNDAAKARLAGLVLQIAERKLSPDTDYVRVWDRLFSDGVSLRRGARG